MDVTIPQSTYILVVVMSGIEPLLSDFQSDALTNLATLPIKSTPWLLSSFEDSYDSFCVDLRVAKDSNPDQEIWSHLC